MDVMRNILGNLSNGIIRLLVTVGILAATYVFIVRPALDTTNKAIDQAGRSFDTFGKDSTDPNNISRQIRQSINQTNQQVQQQIRKAQHGLNHQNGLTLSQQQTIRRQKKLLACIQGAKGDVSKIQRCAKRFQ